MASFIETRLALPFRNATYGIYTAGNAVSLVGTWMQRISVSWLTWEMTHSGLWLGIVAFADFFPGLIVGPIAGAVADRTNQLTVVKISQLISLAQAGVLCALTAAGRLNIWGLVALTGFQGAVVAFNQPARLALVPSLVASDDLGSAIAINSVIFNLARFVGPMFAGLVIVWSGVAAAFAANAVSYVAFLVALLRINVSGASHEPGRRRDFSADLKDGIRYTASHPAIGALLLLLTAIGIGGRPLNQLLPAFSAQIFHLGAGGFSVLASAAGAGAILGGLWVGHRSQSLDLVLVTSVTSVGGAIAAIGACATDTMWVAVPSVAVFGFCLSSAGIAIQTIIQLTSDRAMRGRDGGEEFQCAQMLEIPRTFVKYAIVSRSQRKSSDGGTYIWCTWRSSQILRLISSQPSTELSSASGGKTLLAAHAVGVARDTWVEKERGQSLRT